LFIHPFGSHSFSLVPSLCFPFFVAVRQLECCLSNAAAPLSAVALSFLQGNILLTDNWRAKAEDIKKEIKTAQDLDKLPLIARVGTLGVDARRHRARRENVFGDCSAPDLYFIPPDSELEGAGPNNQQKQQEHTRQHSSFGCLCLCVCVFCIFLSEYDVKVDMWRFGLLCLEVVFQTGW
jgi:hypothetical protein